MTKRSLYITILILIVLDLAATAWWAAGHFNADGKSRFLDSGDVVAMADTVPNPSKPDKFRLLDDHAYYRAGTTYDKALYSSVIFIKAKWPASINGDNSAAELKEALMGKLFSRQYQDIKQAFDSTLAQPRFVANFTKYSRTDARPMAHPGFSTEYYYRAYPCLTSDRLLEYHVEHNTFDGYKAKRTVAMVHYDRVQRQVITVDMVLDLAQKDKIINLINRRIQYFVNADGMELRNTGNLPQEFMIGQSGIIFIFPAGDIAPEKSGIIEIKVKYDDIKPFLTSYFRKILEENAHYKALPEIKFN